MPDLLTARENPDENVLHFAAPIPEAATSELKDRISKRMREKLFERVVLTGF